MCTFKCPFLNYICLFKNVTYKCQIVDIYSDGVRMQGTVWRPDGMAPGETRPAIVLCHGWGGKRSHLDFSYCTKFAKAGFIAMTFDYRGWGESDGVLVMPKGAKQPQPDEDGLVDVKAKVVRRIVDPEWQNRDVKSALDFITSVEGGTLCIHACFVYMRMCRRSFCPLRV